MKRRRLREMMHHMYGQSFLANGNFWLVGLCVMLIKIIILIIIIYFAVKLFNKYFQRAVEAKAKNDSAMIILRERYARGEIEAEEFNQRKTELE
jgi:putative membrane protein